MVHPSFATCYKLADKDDAASENAHAARSQQSSDVPFCKVLVEVVGGGVGVEDADVAGVDGFEELGGVDEHAVLGVFIAVLDNEGEADVAVAGYGTLEVEVALHLGVGRGNFYTTTFWNIFYCR